MERLNARRPRAGDRQRRGSSPIQHEAASVPVPLRSAAIDDAAQQAGMQPWVSMECHQLTPGREVGWIDTLDLGSHRLVREQQTAAVHKLGVTPPNFCTISVCSPGEDCRISAHGGSREGDVFFLPGGTEFDLHVAAGVQTAYVSFPEDKFLTTMQALRPDIWDKPPTEMTKMVSSADAIIGETVKYWFDLAGAAMARCETFDPDLLRKGLVESVLRIAAAAGPDEGQTPNAAERARAFRIGKRAQAIIEERFEEGAIPAVSELCTALGVSERGLQYAFQQYVGVSPLAYIRLCRLNRARTLLRCADPDETTVTEVAMRFGFLHFGRFAADYRRFFHELPSATLAA